MRSTRFRWAGAAAFCPDRRSAHRDGPVEVAGGANLHLQAREASSVSLTDVAALAAVSFQTASTVPNGEADVVLEKTLTRGSMEVR
jgi:hypothetical protein